MLQNTVNLLSISHISYIININLNAFHLFSITTNVYQPLRDYNFRIEYIQIDNGSTVQNVQNVSENK